jgi:hypothetical protein
MVVSFHILELITQDLFLLVAKRVTKAVVNACFAVWEFLVGESLREARQNYGGKEEDSAFRDVWNRKEGSTYRTAHPSFEIAPMREYMRLVPDFGRMAHHPYDPN